MAWPTWLRGLFGKTAPPPVEPPPAAPPPPARSSPSPPPEPEAPAIPTTTTDMHDPALEAAIRANPDDRAALLVYADWLTERGDVRGEFIALSIAVEDTGSFEAEKRIAYLGSRFHEHLYGYSLAAADSETRAGFVRSIAFDDEPNLDRLRALLEHPYGMLVTKIAAPAEWQDGVATLVAGRTPAVEVVERTTADQVTETLGAEVYVDEARGVHATFSTARWMEGGAHAFITRTRIALPGGTTHTWSFGSSDGLSEQGLDDDPPYSGSYHLPPGVRGPFTVHCEVRIANRTDAGTVRADYRGSVLVHDVAQPLYAFAVSRVAEPLAGVPFDPSPLAPIAAPTLGPAISRRTIRNAIDDVRMAALPGRGVFDPDIGRLLLADGGEVAIADLAPHAASYPCGATGSPDGKTLAIGHRGTAGATVAGWLTAVTFGADGKPKVRHVSGGRKRTDVAVALDGERVALLALDELALYDAKTGKQLWRVDCSVAECEPNVIAHGDELILVANDTLQHFALADGALRVDRELQLVHADTSYAIAPAHHDATRDRTIQVTCIADDLLGPRTTIAWRDGTGPRAEVCVADEGRPAAGDEEFGTIGVLPDGRILAIGTQVWLVDPATRTVGSLGPAGSYQRPLLVTRAAGDRYRLWNRSAGPWFLELT